MLRLVFGPVVLGDDVTDLISVPAEALPGEYVLALGVVKPDSVRFIVQLGIQGRAADGWYPLSKLIVAK